MPGRVPLGDKCNAAAEHITTPYMCVVDDDDYLQPSFASAVVPLMEAAVDYVGFRVLQIIDGKFYGIVSTSGDEPRFNHETGRHGPCPKGLTRTELWRQVPFGNDYRADRRWIKSMHQLINTHAFVDRVLYVYDHHTTKQEWGASREVGEWPADLESVEVLAI